MFGTVRLYAGLPSTLLDSISVLAAEASAVLVGVPGVEDCRLIRTRDGLIVVTTGRDEAGLVESARRFAAWWDRQLPGLKGLQMSEVWAGDVIDGTEPATGALAWDHGHATGRTGSEAG